MLVGGELERCPHRLSGSQAGRAPREPAGGGLQDKPMAAAAASRGSHNHGTALLVLKRAASVTRRPLVSMLNGQIDQYDDSCFRAACLSPALPIKVSFDLFRRIGAANLQ